MLSFAKSFYLLVITSLATVALISITQSAPAYAAPQSITMSPTSVDESIQPGSVTNGSFQVINSGSNGYNFHIYATPYRVIGEDYNQDFTPVPGAENVANWFQFSNPSAYIAPKKLVNINYSIHVPAGTMPGGHYAVAFAQTQSQPNTANGVVVTDRVGEIFYLRVAGNVTEGGKVLTWKASLLQKSPLTGTVRIEDSGADNFPATVSVKVHNVFGGLTYSFTTTKQILPQTIRRINIPWNNTPSIGLFKISGTAKLLNQTDLLSTKYVLVMSQTVRLILLGVVALTLVMVFYRRSKTHVKN